MAQNQTNSQNILEISIRVGKSHVIKLANFQYNRRSISQDFF